MSSKLTLAKLRKAVLAGAPAGVTDVEMTKDYMGYRYVIVYKGKLTSIWKRGFAKNITDVEHYVKEFWSPEYVDTLDIDIEQR